MPSQPMFSYSCLRLGSEPAGQTVSYGSLNNTINGSSSFSISAWIRVGLSIASPQQIFGDATTTLLGVQMGEAGIVLYTSLQGSDQAPITSPDTIPPNQWTYVVMVYSSSGVGSGPTVNFFIGGVVSGGASVSRPNITGGNFSTTAVGVDISVLAIWPSALPPSQCDDIYKLPSSAATAVYSFVNGAASDVSGNNNPITFSVGAQQYWVQNSLNFPSPGMALLPDPNSTGVNPGSAGAPFSICGWINVAAATSNQTMTVYANGSVSDASFCGLLISVNCTAGQQCSMHVKYGAVSVEINDLQGDRTFSTGEWHWFGVTFSNGNLELYLDGALDNGSAEGAVQMPAFSGPQSLGDIAAAGGGSSGTAPFSGVMQALCIFNVAFAPSNLFSYMTGDPTQSPSCVAFYSFETGQAIDDLSGVLMTLSGAAKVSEYVAAVTRSSANTTSRASADTASVVASARQGTPAPAAEDRFNLRSLAAGLTVDANVRPASLSLSDSELDQIIAGYENVLATCPASLKPRYRQQFRENLHRGLQLQNLHSDPLIGMFSYAKSGDEYVYYHHLPGGPREVCRFGITEVSSDYIAWRIAVVANLLNIIFAALGLAFLGTTLFGAVRQIMANARVATAMKTVLARPFDSSQAGFWFIYVLQALYSLGQIPELVRQMLASSSWWSFAFAVASLVLNLVGMIGTGGAYLGMILAQMGIGIAQFIIVLNDRPSEDTSTSAAAS